jgi:hypothetical protein
MTGGIVVDSNSNASNCVMQTFTKADTDTMSTAENDVFTVSKNL